MIPVIFVLGVTAIKDAFEDRRRRLSDRRINNSTCRVYQPDVKRYVRVLFSELKVGDIVHLSCDEVIPADVLMLRSSGKHGLCFIGTFFFFEPVCGLSRDQYCFLHRNFEFGWRKQS